MIVWDELNTKDGVKARHAGSNLLIAAQLYDVGGGTVESLTTDWKLNDEEVAELLQSVKAAWAAGRWVNRRAQSERRTS